MAFDMTRGGGSYHADFCKGCGQPILDGQPTTTVRFIDNQYESFNGLYHAQCSRPWASLARILNWRIGS